MNGSNNSKVGADDIPPLSLKDLLQETRCIPELARLALHWRQIVPAPDVVGQPILLLPGFGASDWMMEPLRRYLMHHGHRVYRWGLGRNHGRLGELLPDLRQRVQAIVEKRGEPIQVVGWSLGGYMAREIGREKPEWFRHLITLGSPVFGGAKYTIFQSRYRRQGVDLDAIAARIEERFSTPLQVPVTAIYTKTDGIVCWQACLDHRSPHVRHLEVSGSHTGLIYNPDTLKLVEQSVREAAIQSDC